MSYPEPATLSEAKDEIVEVITELPTADELKDMSPDDIEDVLDELALRLDNVVGYLKAVHGA